MSNSSGEIIESSKSGRRLEEIEQASNRYFIHSLSAKLVVIALKLRLTPNMLSLLGMTSGVLSGLCYYFYVLSLWRDVPLVWRGYGYLFLAFALMIFWHICDGADGQLARKNKKIVDQRD